MNTPVPRVDTFQTLHELVQPQSWLRIRKLEAPAPLKFLKCYVLGIAENMWPALDSSPSNSYTVNSCTILKLYS